MCAASQLLEALMIITDQLELIDDNRKDAEFIDAARAAITSATGVNVFPALKDVDFHNRTRTFLPLSTETLRFHLFIPGLNADVSRGGFDEYSTGKIP